MALESEIASWNGFARALRKPEREAFEELMDMSRSTAMAAGNACNPILFEPMIMSILLAQQMKIRELERELKAIKPDKPIPLSSQESNNAEKAQPENTIQTAPSGGGQTRFQ